MTPFVHTTLLLLHLLAAIVWLGGMFFTLFCLRPAALETLPPPQRLPLLEAALRRFFRFVAAAVLLLLGTGLALWLRVGLAQAPPGWHVMATLGLVMALVFAYLRALPYRHFRAQCSSAAWPEAARALDRIRHLVAVNLVLGVGAVIAAVSVR
jgi:uncharacterized membrane protein